MKRAALVLVVLLVAPLSASAQTASVNRHVIGAGGSSSSRLMGTFGQPVVTGAARLCAGFWCGGTPVVMVSAATVVYSATFGQLGSISMLLVLAVLMFGKQIYQWMVQLWSRQPLSR